MTIAYQIPKQGVTHPPLMQWVVQSNPGFVYDAPTNTYQIAPADTSLITKITDEKELWETQLRHFKPEWLYDVDTDKFSQPAANAYHKSQLINYSQKGRFDTENGGMMSTSLAIPVRTDERSKQLITLANEAGVTDLKLIAADDTIHTLAAPAINTLFMELAAFVGSCFTAHSTVVDQINTNFITTLAQIDAVYAGIPNSGSTLSVPAKKRIARVERRPW